MTTTRNSTGQSLTPDRAGRVGKRRSVRALEWLNFFLADVQTGLGPFLAAYLAGSGWAASRVGLLLSFGGFVPILLQVPAGAIVDVVRRKRLLLGAGLTMLTLGAGLLARRTGWWTVVTAQGLIGLAGLFLAPAVAAITLGLVGRLCFDRQFGRNQAFNAGGNVFTALLMAAVAYEFGNRAIFVVASFFSVPTAAAVLSIRGSDIDNREARGAKQESEAGGGGKEKSPVSVWQTGMHDRILMTFLVAAALFHLANAAMLPQLGEMLAKGKPREAAPFMSACIIVTQVVIACTASYVGQLASAYGRRPLLLLGFGALPVRGVLYTLVHGSGLLITVQALDGVANSIFGVVSILVIADRTQGTGRFNLVQGALATMVGVGAASSNAVGGFLVDRFSYDASFLGLATIGACAFLLLWFVFPETLRTSKPTQFKNKNPSPA